MNVPSVDHVPHILTRYLAVQQQAQIVVTEVMQQPEAIGRHTPGDAARLRGIPVVGVNGGRGGHIPGTNPGAMFLH